MGRKGILTGVVLILVGAGAIGLMKLQRRAEVAEIISDEAAWDFRDSLAAATTMEVALLPGGHVARVLREDDGSYLIEAQDTCSVPKSEVRVETWSAADGKGIVFLKSPGTSPAYSEPDLEADVAFDLRFEEGYVPETYPCLGLDDVWFKIDAGGRPAYIEARYVFWDAIDTF